MSAEVSSTVFDSNSDGEDLAPISAEELEGFYLMLEQGIIPELEWQCPGRVASYTPENNNKTETNSSAAETETQEPAAKNDFDFSDDLTPQMPRVRTQNSTPKSAKKKTANFAGVMEVLKKKNAEGAT